MSWYTRSSKSSSTNPEREEGRFGCTEDRCRRDQQERPAWGSFRVDVRGARGTNSVFSVLPENTEDEEEGKVTFTAFRKLTLDQSPLQFNSKFRVFPQISDGSDGAKTTKTKSAVLQKSVSSLTSSEWYNRWNSGTEALLSAKPEAEPAADHVYWLNRIVITSSTDLAAEDGREGSREAKVCTTHWHALLFWFKLMTWSRWHNVVTHTKRTERGENKKWKHCWWRGSREDQRDTERGGGETARRKFRFCLLQGRWRGRDALCWVGKLWEALSCRDVRIQTVSGQTNLVTVHVKMFNVSTIDCSSYNVVSLTELCKLDLLSLRNRLSAALIAVTEQFRGPVASVWIENEEAISSE